MYCKLLVLLCVVFTTNHVVANENTDCVNSENPVVCRGANFLTKVLNQVTRDETVPLLPGLEIVQNENAYTVNKENDERSMTESSNETVLTRLAKYLKTHDLKIKFSDMLGKTDLQEVVNNIFSNDDPAVVEARKKDKGGGYLLMSAMMMGKMMAAMGFGAVGALAMKALGVSMMALMLSALVGLKKLTEGGGDGGHQVHYVSADHHRRRRATNRDERMRHLPYKIYGMKF